MKLKRAIKYFAKTVVFAWVGIIVLELFVFGVYLFVRYLTM